MTTNKDFKVQIFFYHSKTVQDDSATPTMADWQDVIYGLSNDAIFSDLEWTQTQISGHTIILYWICHS